MRRTLGLLAIAGSMACAGQVPITDAQRTAVTDSVKAFTQSIIANINKKDMNGTFAVYSPDANARYTENAVTYPNLDGLKKANEGMLGSLQNFAVTPSRIDVDVLTPDVAVVTTDFAIGLQATGKPAYQGKGVLTMVVQRQSGTWHVVSSHESDANPEELTKAATPGPVKAKPAPKTPAKAPAKTAPRKK